MAVQNSLTKSRSTKAPLAAYLAQDAVKAQINRIVGGKDGQRFISAIVSAVNTNHALQECSNASIVSAALLGESLKLSPSPQLGQYYMVPFNDKNKGKVAQFQLGYKGYIQLALRSGQYKKLNVMAIKEGELVRYDPLNEEIEVHLIEDEVQREQAPTIGYYAMFEYLNGFRKTMYWSKEKMLAHADKYSQAFSKDGGPFGYGGKYHRVSFADYEAGNFPQNDGWMYSSFWYKDFDGMAYKTMLRQLISKWGIMSIDMVSAMDSDLAVINEDGTKDYVESEEYVVDAQESQEAPEQTEIPVYTTPATVASPVAPDAVMPASFGGIDW
ncbi:MAG: recombinase [Sarcina sp.]|nr:recombinase [Sarcina sp.]